jgi:hypothetical protein
MRRRLLTALASATLLAGGTIAAHAAAETAPLASTPGIAIPHAGLFREAAVVCGGNGCGPVQTSAKHKRKFIPLGHG